MLPDSKLLTGVPEVLAGITAGIGAINWGLVETAETNLLTDVLSLSAGQAGIAYLAIAAAGGALVYNQLYYYSDNYGGN